MRGLNAADNSQEAVGAKNTAGSLEDLIRSLSFSSIVVQGALPALLDSIFTEAKSPQDLIKASLSQ